MAVVETSCSTFSTGHTGSKIHSRISGFCLSSERGESVKKASKSMNHQRGLYSNVKPAVFSSVINGKPLSKSHSAQNLGDKPPHPPHHFCLSFCLVLMNFLSHQNSKCARELTVIWIPHGNPWGQRIFVWHCSAASVTEEREGHVVSVQY